MMNRKNRKMSHRYTLIPFVFFLIVQFGFLPEVSAQKIKNVEKQMLKYDFAESVQLLEKIIKKDGKHTLAAKEDLASVNRMMNNPARAAELYAEVTNTEGTRAENYFYYGQMLRTLGKYEEAKEQFLKYDSLVSQDEKDGALYAKYCEEIIPYLNEKENYIISNVTSLNTKYSEFSPALYNDALVFTSDRPRSKHAKIYSWTGNSYLDLYSSDIDYSGQTDEVTGSSPVVFNKRLSQTFHNGTAVFTKDENTVYFTRTTDDVVKKGKNPVATIMLKMYKSENIDGRWSKPEPFYLNSNEYSVGHPALSADGKKLYFVSDMPGGMGGTDLYECTLEGDSWGDAKNLGDKINTSENEMFPYVSEEGTLYFSSNGQLGFGGLDIYSTTQKDGVWQKPENLGKPINSSYDDFGICYVNDTKGFLSSNRPEGLGEDDIYAFEQIKTIAPLPPLMLAGRVMSDSGYAIQHATIFFLNENTNKILILKTDSAGRYETEVERNTKYAILAKKSHYLEDCTSVNLADTLINPEDLILSELSVKKSYSVENIYYDFNKYDIKEAAKSKLDHLVRLLKDNPIKIELNSYTDSRGSAQYNMILSQKRAEAAMDYIVSQGIDASRITARGYGESELLNDCTDGVECTEEQHQMNRRTEFRIIEVEKPNSTRVDPLDKYVAGAVYDRYAIAEDAVYCIDNGKTIIAVISKKKSGIDGMAQMAPKLEMKKSYQVENIYYDFNKWTLRPDAKQGLNKVVEIMEANPIKIELSSHTDSRGDEAYNLSLSQKRAEAAKNYIVSQGIDQTRIVAKGYGETQLINECTECTEEQNQMNRRTEFKVIEISK